MSKGTPIITIRMNPEWRTQIERIAQEQGISMSDVIRNAIIQYIVEHAPEK